MRATHQELETAGVHVDSLIAKVEARRAAGVAQEDACPKGRRERVVHVAADVEADAGLTSFREVSELM